MFVCLFVLGFFFLLFIVSLFLNLATTHTPGGTMELERSVTDENKEHSAEWECLAQSISI